MNGGPRSIVGKTVNILNQAISANAVLLGCLCGFRLEGLGVFAFSG